MRLKPVNDKIVVKPNENKEEKTVGGIILPDQAIEAESYLSICAKVVRVGPLCWRDRESGERWRCDDWAKPGDWVIIPKFTQFKMDIEGKEYRFVNDDEIIAVIDDPTSIKVYT